MVIFPKWTPVAWVLLVQIWPRHFKCCPLSPYFPLHLPPVKWGTPISQIRWLTQTRPKVIHWVELATHASNKQCQRRGAAYKSFPRLYLERTQQKLTLPFPPRSGICCRPSRWRWKSACRSSTGRCRRWASTRTPAGIRRTDGEGRFLCWVRNEVRTSISGDYESLLRLQVQVFNINHLVRAWDSARAPRPHRHHQNPAHKAYAPEQNRHTPGRRR